MKHRLLAIFSALAVLLLASNAFASIALIPSVKQANLSRNDSIGLRFQLKNLGFERICISLLTEENDEYLETSLSDDHVCLNEYESTRITLTIRTRNAPKGLHIVMLEAESDEGDAVATVSVFVGEEPEIELVAYSNDICRGKQEHINVLVRNNSDEFKQVSLHAENEMLLPYFERSELSLLPFQEKYVELRLHPSPYSAIGRHYVSMYAVSEDEAVKKRVAIDVVECGEEEKALFSVRIGRGCFIVEKDEPEKIYFRVRNKSEEEQKLYFSVGSVLDARLQSRSAWLEDGEEREFYFEVNIAEEAKVKDYNVTLRVWNSQHSVEKSLCVRPRKTHAAAVEVKENDLAIRQCESAVFTLVLRNEGDYSEEFWVELLNQYSQIEAVLSEDELTLEKHSSREVYVSVNVLPDAKEGDYSIAVEIETDREDFEKQLRFRVVAEEAEIELPALQIVGYASSLRMQENSEKSLFVTVRNNSEQHLKGISITLLGLPSAITTSIERNAWLLPNQEKQFELSIKADEGSAGEYSLVLQAGNLGSIDEKPVRLVVQAAEEESEETGLAGLVGLFAAGGSALLGLAALVILIMAIVLISKALRRPSTKVKKEVWMRG